MNLFHSLEEHAQTLYALVADCVHNQMHNFGGVDPTMQYIADTLKAHLTPVDNSVEPPAEHADVELFVAEAEHLGGLGE